MNFFGKSESEISSDVMNDANLALRHKLLDIFSVDFFLGGAVIVRSRSGGFGNRCALGSGGTPLVHGRDRRAGSSPRHALFDEPCIDSE